MSAEQHIEEEQGQRERAPGQEFMRELWEFTKMVLWFVLLFLVLKTYVIEGYEVQGDSMEPTLETNERILVFKLPHILSQYRIFSGLTPIEQGDIVVFQSPDERNKRYVKRVVAAGPKRWDSNTVVAVPHGEDAPPGDGVSVVIDGERVYVNNRLIEEHYVSGDTGGAEARVEETVSAGKYYVLGDHRRVSKDSRAFGAIDDEQVIGKAVLRFWPLSRIGLVQ